MQKPQSNRDNVIRDGRNGKHSTLVGFLSRLINMKSVKPKRTVTLQNSQAGTLQMHQCHQRET